MATKCPSEGISPEPACDSGTTEILNNENSDAFQHDEVNAILNQIVPMKRGKFKGIYDTRKLRCYNMSCRLKPQTYNKCNYCQYLTYVPSSLGNMTTREKHNSEQPDDQQFTIQKKRTLSCQNTNRSLPIRNKELEGQLSTLIYEITEFMGHKSSIKTNLHQFRRKSKLYRIRANGEDQIFETTLDKVQSCESALIAEGKSESRISHTYLAYEAIGKLGCKLKSLTCVPEQTQVKSLESRTVSEELKSDETST